MSFLDRNADNKVRLRRNAQRTRKGEGAISVPVTPPIDNSSGSIAINLANSGGLGVSSSKLTVKLPASSGLALSTSGLAANVDGSTITINGSNQLTVTAYTFQSSDHTITISPSGFFVDFGVVTRTGSGLTKSLGVIINTDTASTAINASNQIVVRGFEQLAADPSPQPGQGWFNFTTSLYKLNLAGFTPVISVIPAVIFSGSASSVVLNTTSLTAFTPSLTVPAGFFNLLGRTIKATLILGGSGVSGNFALSIQYGGTTIWTSPSVATGTMGNLWIELLITTVTTGSSGALLVLGKVFNTATPYTATNALTTVNLTTSNALAMAGQFTVASVSNQAQVSFWSFELLG